MSLNPGSILSAPCFWPVAATRIRCTGTSDMGGVFVFGAGRVTVATWLTSWRSSDVTTRNRSRWTMLAPVSGGSFLLSAIRVTSGEAPRVLCRRRLPVVNRRDAPVHPLPLDLLVRERDLLVLGKLDEVRMADVRLAEVERGDAGVGQRHGEILDFRADAGASLELGSPELEHLAGDYLVGCQLVEVNRLGLVESIGEVALLRVAQTREHA